jgi:hypothetical protein
MLYQLSYSRAEPLYAKYAGIARRTPVGCNLFCNLCGLIVPEQPSHLPDRRPLALD